MRRILIANRGEVAVRLIRACREAGYETLAVYSTADRHAMHVALADTAVCIGPGAATESYLNQQNLLSAAVAGGADALHPGYGFLSENARFAARVEAEGLTFIGPRPDSIRLMSDKIAAISEARSAGLSTVPGSTLTEETALQQLPASLQPPLVIKAAAGGGGRGMRLARSTEELGRLLVTAREEALTFFSDGRLYVEQLLARPRHIELQVLGDGEGRVWYLGSRECSVQRRFQKVVEEAPAPKVDASLLNETVRTSLGLCRRLRYRSLGTLEFLYSEGRLYFIEMNTRLQVEHPVTEMITGQDLVRQQLLVAEGKGPDVSISRQPSFGHAIECRINAEDNRMQPSPGQVETAKWPTGPGIRVDTWVASETRIPHFYDSLVGKITAWGMDRQQAVARMAAALDETRIQGIHTNLELHKAILGHEDFVKPQLDTGWLERTFNRRVT